MLYNKKTLPLDEKGFEIYLARTADLLNAIQELYQLCFSPLVTFTLRDRLPVQPQIIFSMLSLEEP